MFRRSSSKSQEPEVQEEPAPLETINEAPESEDMAEDLNSPLKAFTKRPPAHLPPPRPAAAPYRGEVPRRGLDLPTAPAVPAPAAAIPPIPSAPAAPVRAPAAPAVARRDEADGKTLIVGRDIHLSGAISACDALVVQGTVEANISDAKVLEIADGGLFKGTAQVDQAHIAGIFRGDLTVHHELVITASGRVFGTIRYSHLVVERGGEMHGDVGTLNGGIVEEAPRAADRFAS